MAQIQFRSDDTSLWEEKFGNGSDGSLTISSNTTDSPVNTTCSGTSSSTTLNVGSSTGFSVDDLVIIHQSRNGSATTGTWQLNKINNISGTTWTMKYSLVDTFNTTAQVQKLPQYTDVTVNAGVTWTGSSWNGTEGGILAFLCSGTTTVNGVIDLSGKGYRGGIGGAANTNQAGYRGEGTAGDNGTQSTSASGTAAGGGGGRAGGANNAAGAGGGGHASNGGAGGVVAPNTATPGAAGTASNTSGLTRIIYGAGGSGAGASPFVSGRSDGGNSGGIIIILTKDIAGSGTIKSDGANGTTNAAGGASAASAGTGGSILFKSQVINFTGMTVSANKGTNATANSGGGPAGLVSSGIIHADYLTSVTGTTSPTLSSRQDTSLTGASGSGTGSSSFLYLMV